MPLSKIKANSVDTASALSVGSLASSGAITTNSLTSAGGMSTTLGSITSNGTTFDSAVILNNTGTGGKSWSLYSTMNSFSQGGGKFMVYHTDAAGQYQLGIDSAGYVTKPFQPYLHATVGSGTTAINFGTTHANVVVPYNTIFTNTGNHFNTSTNRFTCPVAGIYLVYASLQVGGASGTSGVGPNMQVTRSGSAVTGSYHFVLTGNGYQKMEANGYVKCAANDTLYITLYTGSAMSGGSTEFNGDSRNSLCIAFIG